MGGETPTRGHGHGPLPSPLLFATAPSQITKHLFLTADGGELARSPDSYILISVYSAVSKENLSQKNIIPLTLPPNICSLISFFFFSHRSPKGTNGVLYFQLWRKKNYLGANYLSVEVWPFTKRQITSDEGIVPRTSSYVSVKCCAASSTIIEGQPGIRGIGKRGLMFALRKPH